VHNKLSLGLRYYAPAIGRINRLSDTTIHPSVSLSHSAAALGYRHAGCLQLSHVRTADPSAYGSRSTASRTAIGGGGISSRRPRGDNLLSQLWHAGAWLDLCVNSELSTCKFSCYEPWKCNLENSRGAITVFAIDPATAPAASDVTILKWRGICKCATK